MSKQDGYASRTAADLERKYNFGKTFAEVYGLVADARKAAEEAQNAFDGLDQEAIFGLLTNDGKAQGIYRDDAGNVYVNASYIKVGGIADEGLLDVMATTEDLETLRSEFKVSENGVSSTIEAYRKDLEGYKEQVSEYEQTVDGFRQTVSGYSSAVAGYADDVAGYADEVDAYTREVASLELKVDEFNTKVESYEAEVSGYRSEYSEIKQTSQQISSKVSSIENTIGTHDEQLESIASDLESQAGAINNNTAKISSITQTVESISSTVSNVETRVSENETSIKTLRSDITQTANKISAVVSAVDDSSGNVTAASIVAAINSAGSSVKISADHINLTGDLVTISDLSSPGKVEIDAGNIKAGGTLEGVALTTTDQGLGSINIDGSGIIMSYGGYDGASIFYDGSSGDPVASFSCEGDLSVASYNVLELYGDKFVNIVPGYGDLYWRFWGGTIELCNADGPFAYVMTQSY